jgi:hypothetical protein
MKDEKVKLFSGFIKFLRYEKDPRETVKTITEKTKLTRLTLLEIQKEKRDNITLYVDTAFREGYGTELSEFELQQKEDKVNAATVESDLNQLIATNSELAKAYSSIVDKYINLQKECNEFRLLVKDRFGDAWQDNG